MSHLSTWRKSVVFVLSTERESGVFVNSINLPFFRERQNVSNQMGNFITRRHGGNWLHGLRMETGGKAGKLLFLANNSGPVGKAPVDMSWPCQILQGSSLAECKLMIDKTTVDAQEDVEAWQNWTKKNLYY